MRHLTTHLVLLCLAGVSLVPGAVYLFGTLFAGPYDESAGFLQFLGSIYVDLGAAALWAWLLVLSPVLLYLAVRLAIGAWNALRQASPQPADESR